MTSALFQDTLHDQDAELRWKKKKILLLVDNCPAQLKLIKFVFLPPNTTAVLQPMDQGVIKNMKAKYRKFSKITVLDAIIMLDEGGAQFQT